MTLVKSANWKLFACLHLETRSMRLFIVSDLFDVMILSFSVRHRLHFFVVALYGLARSPIFHSSSKLSSLFFKFQIYFDSSVLFRYRSCLKDVLWLA